MLHCVAPPNFSPLPMGTLAGFAALLPTDSRTPRNTLYMCTVGWLAAGTSVGTPSYSPQVSAPLSGWLSSHCVSHTMVVTPRW